MSSPSTRDVAQRTLELGRGSRAYALVRVCVRERARDASEGDRTTGESEKGARPRVTDAFGVARRSRAGL